MSWLVLGLAATALGSLVVTIDKIVVERNRKTPWIYAYFMTLFLGIYSVVLLLFRVGLGLFEAPTGYVTLIAMLPGLIHYVNAYLYTRALLWTDPSTAQAISQLRPVLAILWGFLVFGDVFAPSAYVGVLIVVTCSVLLSLERSPTLQGRFRFGPAYKYLLLGAFLNSLADLSIKVALTDLSYWDTFILNRLGILLPVALVFAHPAARRVILDTLEEQGARFLGVIAVIELAAMLSLFLTVMAFSRGPLALVSTTLATTPMFVVIYTQLLNRMRAGVVPLANTHGSTVLRWALLIGIVGGVYFMRTEG